MAESENLKRWYEDLEPLKQVIAEHKRESLTCISANDA